MNVIERVLVTGAAGMIGRAVTRHLAQLDVPVTALVLDDPGDLPVDRVVVGDARDREAVRDALDGVDAVVHLAAAPTPLSASADAVFGGNTAATFTVLDTAGEQGIKRAVIASSINALGYKFSPVPDVHPAYLPLDERLPSVAADPYSLSKRVDEIVAAGMTRRYGMDVVALRLPMVGGFGDVEGLDSQLPGMFEFLAANPQEGAADLWLYLEVRDAARAVERALQPAFSGSHVVFVAAAEVSVPYPTEQLLDRYHPHVPRRRRFPGRTAPVDLRAAETVLGFRAEFVAPMTMTTVSDKENGP